jgi:hypothetical protein
MKHQAGGATDLRPCFTESLECRTEGGRLLVAASVSEDGRGLFTVSFTTYYTFYHWLRLGGVDVAGIKYLLLDQRGKVSSGKLPPTELEKVMADAKDDGKADGVSDESSHGRIAGAVE